MNAQANEVSEATEATDSKVARIVEQVKMTDGRTVEFVGKRKMLKESFINGMEVDIRLDFRNGETRTFRIPDSLLIKFAAHGAEQKLGDETAGVPEVEDMILGVDELIGRLEKGEWSTQREGGGMTGTSVLMKALMEHSGRTAEQVKAFLVGKSQKEKLALRASPKIKPIIDKLEAEKQAKSNDVDTEALLGGL